MHRDDIAYLISHYLGTSPRKVGDSWVMTNCPFAPKTHVGGDDKKLSFGISVSNTYHCFACGAKGHLSNFPIMLSMIGIISPSVSIDMTFFISEKTKEQRIGGRLYISKEDKEKSPPDLKLFRDFPLARRDQLSPLYLTEEDAQKWEIRYNPLEDSLLFPVFNKENQLVDVKVRKNVNGKRIFYTWGASKNTWYGSHFPLKGKYLFLVEGERDAILLHRYVDNVWASLGTPTIAMINDLPSDMKIIMFFDNDIAGETIRKKVLKHLKVSHLLSIENYDFKDPAEVIEKGDIKEAIKQHLKEYRR